MASPANTAESAALAARFQSLADQWKAAVAFVSSTSVMVSHPAYRAIIALGPAAAPLILRDLEREPAHWFEALRAVTGENPVRREDWGKVQVMRDAWLAWGRGRGLI